MTMIDGLWRIFVKIEKLKKIEKFYFSKKTVKLLKSWVVLKRNVKLKGFYKAIVLK